MRNSFRIDNNRIDRTCHRSENDYNLFLDDLISDFNNRCGYCDTSFKLVGNREIDHFIPQTVCKQFNKNDLINSYSNLVLSCIKCNRRKGPKCSPNNGKAVLENILFYDPGSVDFNKIFYRNKFGMICSDDEKGQGMIEELRLHNPIYTISWLIETLERMISKYENKYCNSDDIEIIKTISSLEREARVLRDLFVNNYQFLK